MATSLSVMQDENADQRTFEKVNSACQQLVLVWHRQRLKLAPNPLFPHHQHNYGS